MWCAGDRGRAVCFDCIWLGSGKPQLYRGQLFHFRVDYLRRIPRFVLPETWCIHENLTVSQSDSASTSDRYFCVLSKHKRKSADFETEQPAKPSLSSWKAPLTDEQHLCRQKQQVPSGNAHIQRRLRDLRIRCSSLEGVCASTNRSRPIVCLQVSFWR